MVRAQQRGAAGEPEPTSMTLRTWSAQWLQAKKDLVRPSSWVSMEGAMRLHILPQLADVQLRRLTRALIVGAYARMGLSPKTTHNAHLVLHRCLADAVEERFIARNPADRAHALPRDARPEMRTWTLEEVRRFLDYTASDPLAAMWRLFVTTGMRRGEVVALRREDLNLDAGFLMVRRSLVRSLDGWTTNPPKTIHGRRRVDLDPATVAALRRHLVTPPVLGVDG
jgi:integrase